MADHSHHNHAHHTHTRPDTKSRAFVVAIVLNSAFIAIEFFYGWIANSTALMADASHNLSDVLGLVIAWVALVLARKTPDERYTFGLHSSSILAALANAMFILVTSGAIAWEAASRFFEPHQIEGSTVTLVAAAGIVINGFSAWLFVKGSKEDLNIRGAYIHMASDAAVSLGVVISSVLMMQTQLSWIDPATSLLIVTVVVWGTWGLLKESIQLALNAVPSGISLAEIQNHLLELPGVASFHHLHVWGISTTESALSVHLVMPSGYPGDEVMESFSASLLEKFKIRHCTLQFELGHITHACVL